LQSISGVSAINPLVAFYDIHGGKREVLFFYFVPDTTRDVSIHTYIPWFIPEGVAEASQIFLRDTFYQHYLAVRNTADVTSGKPDLVAVYLRCKCYYLVAFYDIHGRKREAFIWPGYLTRHYNKYNNDNYGSLNVPINKLGLCPSSEDINTLMMMMMMKMFQILSESVTRGRVCLLAALLLLNREV
jgi:hypothetical protein